MNACFADGSVHTLSGSLSGNVWWALCTINGLATDSGNPNETQPVF